MKLQIRTFQAALTTASFLLPLLHGISLPAIAADIGTSSTLPTVNLRGYGALSGTYRTITGTSNSSVLTITCESVPKAQVVLAKYLSDLACLPGVSDATVPSKPTLAAHVISEQGAVTAVRVGSKVYIVTAADLKGLANAVAQLPKSTGPMVSKAEVFVPMYLDRWDKYGFRFYYRPWEKPKGLPKTQIYDTNHEFEWAKAQGQSGLVFWSSGNSFDNAEGLNNDVWWDWAEKAAKKYHLPTAINDSRARNLNRYRDQQELKMPQYVGDFYSVARQDIGGAGSLSWNATTAADAEFGQIQSTVKEFNNDPNVVSWLEPHGELQDSIFMEYGPVADAGYQKYLKETYGTLSALGERWYGDANHFQSWDQVRVPELASFLGWGPDALDMTGTWRIGYESWKPGVTPLTTGELSTLNNKRVEGTIPAPDEWYSSKFDDSAWPTLETPGNDAVCFLPHSPAVYRRTFDVPASWHASHQKVWLYLWDLSLGSGDTVRVRLNDTELPSSTVLFNQMHWCALDVSDSLKPGSNFIAMRMPKGYFAYRMYLSSDPPLQYPNLGIHKNTQWVDLTSWERWIRADMVKRGIEMIRQVDPNRNITMMHPDDYSDYIKQYCEQYGAEFHNTGYMGAFYADLNPMVMNGGDLPFSTEPGGPASNLQDFKNQMGLWYSEGIQSVDYFIHIGDVLWNDQIRNEFEKTQNKVHMFGKYHTPKAKVAALYSFRMNAANRYPWGSDPNTNFNAGYWAWNVTAPLQKRCDRDAVTDSDFANGEADAYKVIVDTNTSVMDDKLVSDIEKYVRNGGVFITYAQTGRHTPLQFNTWPIAKLTGYQVTHIDQLTPRGEVQETRSLQLAPGQGVFDQAALTDFNGTPANGLSLKSQASDTHDLLVWSDGTVAAGYRQLGKGMIVQIGCKWTGAKLPDRLDPGSASAQTKAITTLLSKLMDWQQIPQLPGRLLPDTDTIRLRRYVSNNGLYDVWTMFNQSATQSLTANLAIDGPVKRAFDVDTAQSAALVSGPNGVILKDITLEPKQTRIFLTTHGQLQTAALDWFTLQRNWWRGTTKPSSVPLPAPQHRYNVDLGQDWQWRALTDTDNAEQIAQSTGTTGWETMRIGVWTIPDHLNVKHGLFRRSFTVPEKFTGGRVSLWLNSTFNSTFVDRGRVWLDGKLVRDWSPNGIADEDYDGAFKPGSTHTLAVEIDGQGSLLGARGTCWLAWKPNPLNSIDLAGQWTPSSDLLHYTALITLPASYNAQSLKRTVNVPASFAGHNIVFSAEIPTSLNGILINNHWVQPNGHAAGNHMILNITPWVKIGAENTIEMLSQHGPSKGTVNSVALEAYAVNSYP